MKRREHVSSPRITQVSSGEARRKQAVIYARVSTAKQVNRDVDPDGYSLPAQEDACLRKAEALGAEVIEVYVDRGESAKTADRPEFQRLLTRIRTTREVDYVIVDKIDRLARNRRDDANILFEFKMAGVELVSVKENIDQTPTGGLVHGILATVAEWESRNNAVRAVTGMTQKAKVGGTPTRAPIGYLNIGQRIDDREIRTVAVDPDRAPLIQWAFEAYASGEWTLTALTDALHAKGLKSIPQGKRVPVPIARSKVARLLKNRYYIGYVTFKGVEYEGRHQPIIDRYLFERVQEVLRTHHRAGEKQRIHSHYLKGSVFCGRCGSRLCLTNAKGRYLYFFCLGRQQGSGCPQPYVPAEEVEAAVERYYQRFRIPDNVVADLKAGIEAELDHQRQRAAPEIRAAERRLEALEQERRRLSRGVVEDTIPGDLAREEHERIDRERHNARRVLEAADTIFAHVEKDLEDALALAGRCHEVYLLGSARVRRLSNQCFFEKLLVNEGEVAGTVVQEPWATLLSSSFIDQMQGRAKNPDLVFSGRGSNKDRLARSEGLEPPTF
jgi:site-specific DNA recombinase